MSVPGFESKDAYNPTELPTSGGRGRTRRRRSSRKGKRRTGKRGGTAHKMPSVGGRKKRRRTRKR